jgi:prolyl oligopeptidase
MRKTINILAILLLAGCGSDTKNADENLIMPVFEEFRAEYPETYRDDNGADTFLGKRVPDPYHWLEKEGAYAQLQWLEAQRAFTDEYFQQIAYREAIRSRLLSLWNYERRSAPVKLGDYFYFLKNDGLQQQAALCRARSLDGAQVETLVDPNLLSSTAPRQLKQFSLSPDGSFVAYEMADQLSGWSEVYVRRLDGDRARLDTLRWVSFSDLSWYRDGFFYSSYQAPEEGQALEDSRLFHQVHYHRIGNSQTEDEVVFADRQNALRRFKATCTEDGRYLVLSAYDTSGLGNALFFRDLEQDEWSFKPIIESFAHDFALVGSDEDSFYVLSNYRAPKRRLLRISALGAQEPYWQEVIPQREEVLQEAHIIGGKIVAHYLSGGSSQLRVFSLQGQEERLIPLPGIGSLAGITGRPGSAELFYQFTSLVQPGILFRYDLSTGEQEAVWQAASEFDGNAYEIKQVAVKSYDQAEVPLFIVHRKGLNLDGARPSLLIGHGAQGRLLQPAYNPTGYMLCPLILEQGGICAIALVRGGGELGADWQAAGQQYLKQNSFDDFQAAAEYLIGNRYTSPQKLGLHGTGAGGLLVGASLTQRYDLFAVALPVAGLFDILHYRRLQTGTDWSREFGVIEKDSDFDYLMAYSPLHNLSPERYPATLLLADAPGTGVGVPHSYKFAASLQAHQEGAAPILLRPAPASPPANRRLDEGADMMAFLWYNLREGFRKVSKE